MFHETVIRITACTPSNYVAIFHEQDISLSGSIPSKKWQYSLPYRNIIARAPSKYVAVFRV
jgi:hypothetical protein